MFSVQKISISWHCPFNVGLYIAVQLHPTPRNLTHRTLSICLFIYLSGYKPIQFSCAEFV